MIKPRTLPERLLVPAEAINNPMTREVAYVWAACKLAAYATLTVAALAGAAWWVFF